MSEASKHDHGQATARALPLVLPMPRGFYRSAASSRRWFAIDPVFGAQCLALCRSIRLTLLTLIAFISGPRTLRGQTHAAQEINAPSAEASNETETASKIVSAKRLDRFTHAAKREPAVSVERFAGVPAKNTANFTLQRTHAPPALAPQTAFRLFLQDLPPPSFVFSHPSARNIAKSNSFHFVVLRTHAPPARLYRLHRRIDRTLHFQRSAPTTNSARLLCLRAPLLSLPPSLPPLRFAAHFAAISPIAVAYAVAHRYCLGPCRQAESCTRREFLCPLLNLVISF